MPVVYKTHYTHVESGCDGSYAEKQAGIFSPAHDSFPNETGIIQEIIILNKRFIECVNKNIEYLINKFSIKISRKSAMSEKNIGKRG
jgi:hypothetical protein